MFLIVDELIRKVDDPANQSSFSLIVFINY